MVKGGLIATFKVGDKVRIKQTAFAVDSDFRGLEAIVHAIPGDRDYDCLLDVPGHAPSTIPGGLWNAMFAYLEPLTPPDAWAADAVRKVTRPVHVEPVVVKEKA